MTLDYRFLIPTLVSAIAALFSILAFRRNRRFANENHLFEKKIEAYSLILGELNQLLTKYEKHISNFKFVAKNSKIFNPDAVDTINKAADDLDEISDKFRSLCTSSSLLLPKSMLEHIEILMDKIYLSMAPDYNTIGIPNIEKYVDSVYDELLGLSNQINQEMRKDLNVDELNTLLYKRLKK